MGLNFGHNFLTKESLGTPCCPPCRGSLHSSTSGLEMPVSTFLRRRLLSQTLSIFSSQHIHSSLLSSSSIPIDSPASFPTCGVVTSCFSFLPFCGLSIGEAESVFSDPLVMRWMTHLQMRVRFFLRYIIILFRIFGCNFDRV